jgi:hypothetical protein
MSQKVSPFVAAILATALAAPVMAQQATNGTAAASTGKKDLIARILKLQQPGIESMARGLAEQPAVDLMDRAGAALPSRIAADKREAVARDIQSDVKKYLDESVPLVQARAVRLAPTTIGAVMEEKFTEDELRQVVGIIESPVYAKFQQLGGEMQKALAEKLVTEMRPTIDPKVQALEQTLARRLGMTPGDQQGGAAPRQPGNGSAAAKAPARAASR